MKTEEWIHRYNNAFAQASFEQEFWDRRLAPKSKVPPGLIPPGYVEIGHGLRFDFPPTSPKNEIRDNP